MQLTIPESPYRGTVIKAREFSGLRLVDGVYSAKTKVASHAHEQALFCVALNGLCNEVYAGKVRNYEGMTVEFLPSNQSHSIDFPFADTRAFSIEVAPSWLERAREYSLSLEHSVHSHCGVLSAMLMKVYREFLETDSASPLAIEGLTLEMLAEASRSAAQLSDPKPPRWLAQADEFLHDRFAERVTIIQVASEAGVHPVHLAREFRRFHHCTIGEYVRRLRIERACRQLRNSDESLAAIACGAGFSDQSHFSRTFKRVTGMTPAAYRATLSSH
ncbi:MAG: AraC family transcriptional regulator [Acidobacteria bacterium]|nr:MAG: AraC family transcriptional regulator [Acidobacteriota bacterium]